jgi:hypothetical protein
MVSLEIPARCEQCQNILGSTDDIHPNPQHYECMGCGECHFICQHEPCRRCFSFLCLCTFCLECREKTFECACDISEESISCLVWDLPQSLGLARLAADFYTLYRLSLDKRDEGMFVEFLDTYTPIFARYTDMVIGGELRHMRDSGAKATPLERALEKDYWSGGLQSKRSRAWVQWHGMRKQYGAAILAEASEIFRKRGGNSYGGNAWARITDILYRYETGVFSATLFLDSIWGLRHNTSTYFSKMPWSDKYLMTVLNSNLYGDSQNILRDTASDYVRVIEEGVVCDG